MRYLASNAARGLTALQYPSLVCPLIEPEHHSLHGVLIAPHGPQGGGECAAIHTKPGKKNFVISVRVAAVMVQAT
jgi:hypothetical protein